MTSHDTIRAEVRSRFARFIEEQINPGAVARDEVGSPIPRECMQMAAEIGLLGYAMPTELGGGGGDPMRWGMVLEEVGYLSSDLSLPMLLYAAAGVADDIYISGRQDLIDRYVRPMVKGEHLGAFAYSDGADPFSFKTVARKVPGGYILDGEKKIITGGANADVFLTYARSESDDLLVFLVERDDPGAELKPRDVTGFRAAGLSILQLTEVRIPDERVLVEADGISHAQRFLNKQSCFFVCGPMGRMQAILEACIRQLAETVRYQRPLTELQNVQSAIGRMYVAMSTARLSLHHALGLIAQGQSDPLWDPSSWIAKYQVTESALEVVLTAMRLLGAQGVFKTEPYERYLRDISCMLAGGNPQDLLLVDLGIAVTSRLTGY